MPSSNSPLPSQEANLFKKILKCYEQKQYKKGLQYVKEILKKFPEHGETLSMKGLILNYTNKKKEAYECAQQGLRHDFKSHVCWHVYGLIQRSDRKYDEAIKCYRNALKCDTENLQILRDLSLLQIQIRDLEGYRDTRYELFRLRPTQRASWIGYAMSYHLLKDFSTAISILDEFSKTQQLKQFDFETSEYLLYQNMVLRESGLYDQALEHLTKHQSFILDKLAVEENKAELNKKLNKLNEVERIYYELIERNPNNLSYYKKLEICKNLDTTEKKVEFYHQFSEKYPRADLPKKIPLEFLTGNEFKEAIDKYMQRAFHKGVPPLFKELKTLYRSSENVQVIEGLCLQYVECLKSVKKFSENSSEKEPPTSLLWVYYYLAQHYDYLNNTTNALKFINIAIDDTPTLVELYMIKGKIFKHAGNLYAAVQWLDEAQSLDTADRFINYKCSKYMLRANMIKESQDIAAKFTREGVAAFDYLKEMQCMWFETECANAYKRLGKYGEALKKCHQVERHFQEIIEDQFDFHSYCMRKMTLRSYVDMLRLEDHIKSHPFFFKAAVTAIEIYLALHDKPLSDNEDDKCEDIDNLTPAELKKFKNKQKRQQLKALAEKEKQVLLEQKKKEIAKQKNKEQDGDLEAISEEDLVPEKLERPENPLEESLKFLKPLEEFAKQHIQTHVLAFEVYFRKNKYLLMLKCLKRMKQIDELNPKFHYYLSKFLISFQKYKTNLNETVVKVIEKELSGIYNGEAVEKLNQELIKNNSNKLEFIIEGSKILYLLNPSTNQKESLSLITNLDDSLLGRTLKNCTGVYKLLKEEFFGKLDEKVLESYKAKCHDLWPHANLFQSDEELNKYLINSNDQNTNLNEQMNELKL